MAALERKDLFWQSVEDLLADTLVDPIGEQGKNRSGDLFWVKGDVRCFPANCLQKYRGPTAGAHELHRTEALEVEAAQEER